MQKRTTDCLIEAVQADGGKYPTRLRGAIDKGTHWVLLYHNNETAMWEVTEYWRECDFSPAGYSAKPRFQCIDEQEALNYFIDLPAEPTVDDYRRLGVM